MPNFIILFLPIPLLFILSCSSADRSQQQDYERMRQRRKGTPPPPSHPPSPRCFRVTAINILPLPPFLRPNYPSARHPLKIIQTTLSFWRRQSLLSKRAISHPLPPQNVGAFEFATRGNPSCPRHKERLTLRVCLRPALNNSPNLVLGCTGSSWPQNMPRLLT